MASHDHYDMHFLCPLWWCLLSRCLLKNNIFYLVKLVLLSFLRQPHSLWDFSLIFSSRRILLAIVLGTMVCLPGWVCSSEVSFFGKVYLLCVCPHACLEARDQPWESFFQTWSLTRTWNADLARLAGQWALGSTCIFPSTEITSKHYQA